MLLLSKQACVTELSFTSVFEMYACVHVCVHVGMYVCVHVGMHVKLQPIDNTSRWGGQGHMVQLVTSRVGGGRIYLVSHKGNMMSKRSSLVF
jgi:hypothetical protein